MKLFLNDSGAVDVAGLCSETTVADFFSAIDLFAGKHPLPCRECSTNCCNKRFFIEMDSISAIRLARGNLKRFISDTLKIVYPSDGTIQILLSRSTECCRYLNASSECSIYEHRPASCRTYTCRPRSPSYDILDTVVAAALQHALIAAYFETLLKNENTPMDLVESLGEPLEWLKASPAYNHKTYDTILVRECLRFDMEGADLAGEEMAAYSRLMAMEE